MVNGQAHPAERGHFKVGGDGGNYDIDTHANIADRFHHDDDDAVMVMMMVNLAGYQL